ncbi:hypothetical protein HPB52_017741 [Rhipicephalus sanguineus]|uniref:Uncharacterized protein n=1 Tax=Rhipicephalus sanguineus TaxID=34632 RepID=A0A9D4Q487_RHISA|nr:hypothetical protein HPB52_017741 [Rhipicephalus sanguineus]
MVGLDQLRLPLRFKDHVNEKDQGGYEMAPARPGAIAGVVIGLSCSLVGFAVLAFAMAFSRHAEQFADDSLVCDTEQCHENGSFLGDSMEDFYSLLDSIITPGELPYPDIYGTHVFFHTYRACTRFMNSSQDTAALTSVIPRLQKHASSLHNLSQRDLVAAIAALSAVSGIDVLFGIGLGLRNKSVYPAIRGGRSIRQAFEGLPDFESHLEAALAAMVAKAPSKELVADVLKLDDVVNAAFENDSDTRLLNLSAITETALQLGPTDWSFLFQKYLRWSHTERFFWTGRNQAESILKVIGSNATSETVRAYLSLQVAAEVLALYFKSILSSADASQPETRKTCLKAACRVSSHACSYQISRLLGLPPIAEADTQVLLDAVVDAFSEKQGLVPWIDSHRWVNLMAMFRNTTVTLPHRLVRPLSDRYTPVYPNISQWSGDFLDEHLTLMADHEAASVSYPLPADMEVLAERQLEGAFAFNEVLKSVVLSGALISAPVLYSATMPTSFDGETSGWNVATASKLFAWTMAARISLDGLLSGAGGIGGPPLPGSKQPPTSPDAIRTFLRRFCLLSCGHDEAHLSARSLCMIPLMGMPEFADAFRCPRGTVMNPNDSCALRFPEQRDLERARKLL